MNLTDYIKNIIELQNEIENILLCNQKNQYLLNIIESYGINGTHVTTVDYGGMYKEIFLDTDLLTNILEQQKEKNEARLNEIKQEISKLQKEDIQL